MSSNRYDPMLATYLPEWAIQKVYERLKEQKLLRWLFFSGEVSTEFDFIKLARSANTLMYFVMDKEENDVVGLFWLNGRTSINCGLHMAVFREYWGRSIPIGTECLTWVFENDSELESLLSFIPDTNRVAKRYALETGWTFAGSIPRLIKDSTTGKITSGTMFYITREDI